MHILLCLSFTSVSQQKMLALYMGYKLAEVK